MLYFAPVVESLSSATPVTGNRTSESAVEAGKVKMREEGFMSKKLLLSIAVFLAWGLMGVAVCAAAQQDAPPQGQQPGQGRRGMNGPPPVMGTLTSVGVDRFEIKKTDGTTQVVMVNDQTHYRQRTGQGQPPQELALEDLKVGDHVFVRGTPNGDKQLVAEAVNRVTAEQFERFQNGGGQGGPGAGGGWGQGRGGPRMGGEITAINGNQIKVQSRRGGERVIVVNDQTTFDKEGKTITLKDLKAGDRIFATGTESNGQFVATAVHFGHMGGGGGRGGWQGGPPPQN